MLGSRISPELVAEKVTHEHFANRLLLLVLTPAFVFVSRAFSEKSDYLTWKLHPNKICTRLLCLSYGIIGIIVVDRAC